MDNNMEMSIKWHLVYNNTVRIQTQTPLNINFNLSHLDILHELKLHLPVWNIS